MVFRCCFSVRLCSFARFSIWSFFSSNFQFNQIFVEKYRFIWILEIIGIFLEKISRLHKLSKRGKTTRLQYHFYSIFITSLVKKKLTKFVVAVVGQVLCLVFFLFSPINSQKFSELRFFLLLTRANNFFRFVNHQ